MASVAFNLQGENSIEKFLLTVFEAATTGDGGLFLMFLVRPVSGYTETVGNAEVRSF